MVRRQVLLVCDELYFVYFSIPMCCVNFGIRDEVPAICRVAIHDDLLLEVVQQLGSWVCMVYGFRGMSCFLS